MENTLTLWHGGRDLEYSYHSFKNPSKNNWEYGPGLYLTTHYETARKYAKGGGKTYKITFELGNDIDEQLLHITDVNDFIAKSVVGSKQKKLLEDVYFNMERMKQKEHIQANFFLNLVINNNAVIGKRITDLNNLLVEHGADYGRVNRYAGRDETVFVLFNLKKILKVKTLIARDVSLNEYELSIESFKQNNLKP